jgi:2-polyprenyl-3-methyl-5-hydroxy-6-metoxy-1,4-benzoquinol methylase
VPNQQASFSILDLGGTESYWKNMDLFSIFPNARIVLVNLVQETVEHTNITSVVGDACQLNEFQDQSYDIVFSNSVIEHLFSFSNQQRMANEVLRIGKNHFIQTPNYYFPIEPHWMFPFFQFLPKKMKIFLTKNFNLGHFPKAVEIEKATARVNEVRLLSTKEMRKLFPNSKLFQEYFLGLVKSITLYSK